MNDLTPRNPLVALVLGVLVGACYPLLAGLADLAWQGLPATAANAGTVWAGNPVHWIVSTVPIFLGLVAYTAAHLHASQVDRISRLERLVEELGVRLDATHSNLVLARDGQQDAEARSRTLELAFEQARDGMALLDPHGAIVHANQAMADMHGRAVFELRGRQSRHCFSAEEYNRRFKPFMHRVLGQGSAATELVHQRSDGTSFLALTNASSVTDNDGVQVGVVVYCRDIEQERETARSLAVETERAQRYFDLAGTMLVALDRDGCVSRINRKGCELLSYTAQEIIGSSWFDRFVPESVSPELSQRFALLMAGDIEDMEYVENFVVDRDGEHHLIA